MHTSYGYCGSSLKKAREGRSQASQLDPQENNPLILQGLKRINPVLKYKIPLPRSKGGTPEARNFRDPGSHRHAQGCEGALRQARS